DIARYRWWAAGGPVHRWNEILLEEMLDAFVTLPLSARHLALLHVALDDAVAAASQGRPQSVSPVPAAVDSALASTGAQAALAPSAHAATAAAAAEILGYLFPARAAHFRVRAEEAMQVRL